VNCFQNFIFMWYSQPSPTISPEILVVNCFQNFIFMWYSQLSWGADTLSYGCELLSEFYLYVIFTAYIFYILTSLQLWIAFRILSLCDIHSLIESSISCSKVVNCFQNFIFMWYSQPIHPIIRLHHSCELLSEFYLYVIFTACSMSTIFFWELWIAFRILSLCDIHSLGWYEHHLISVVNCFQNFIFMWYSQLAHSHRRHAVVVNCFQNFIFMWYSQPGRLYWRKKGGCELLSEFYLYVIFTAGMRWVLLIRWLWIAFRILSLCDIHSRKWWCCNSVGVVNCFQNFIFMWYSQQGSRTIPAPLVVNCFQNFIFMWYSQQGSRTIPAPLVVNCFQNFIFMWYSQRSG